MDKEIISYIITQGKVFLFGLMGGVITEGFYLKTGTRALSIISFIWSVFMFALTTVLCSMYIGDGTVTEKSISLSVAFAFVINFFVPFFINNEEARGELIVFIFKKIGIDITNNTKKNKDEHK